MKHKTKFCPYGQTHLDSKQANELLALCIGSAWYRVIGPQTWVKRGKAEDETYIVTHAHVESILYGGRFTLEALSKDFNNGATLFEHIDQTVEDWLGGMEVEPIFE